MALRGFLRNIGTGHPIRALGELFRPEPLPQRPPEPSQPPPSGPPGGPGGGGPGIYGGPFRDSWDSIVAEGDVADIQERTGYSENEIFQGHFEILRSLDPDASGDDLEQMWDDYLLSFVSDGMSHDTFFEIWNIDPRDFDWQMWRDVMGYTKK